MTVFMLGFAGFPLTGGFVGKFYVFAAAYERGWTWLVIVGVAATAVSLYYYLGVIRAMYFRPSEELQLAPVAGGSPPRELLAADRGHGRDRRHGRLLLRGAAADRRPPGTRPKRCSSSSTPNGRWGSPSTAATADGSYDERSLAMLLASPWVWRGRGRARRATASTG
jgi:hypothetical protein